MYRSRSRFVALAMAACALVGHAVAVAVVQPIAAVCRFLGYHFGEACALASAKHDARPMVALRVKAVAFAASMLKRESPVLSPTWRMCPSV
ncbi:hypothetical protein N5C12_09935 [Comamonas aquatica]|uniref:hypothetical protein n=1 Tax=Comamonas aquatica TaxID=225991 RepID=UPI002447A7AE|nr:hypothetical protein [Comamonas aquatica]MDH0899670.1 hypothetical protein [Comamonas aquatica]